MMRIKRIVWKRPPTEREYQQMEIATIFGPSVFQRDNEWLFLVGEDPRCHAPTPEGYIRIN